MFATCSILVVEDDAGVRAVLADALDLEGFEVRLAANGRDALGVLGRWRPDLILTDLDMPIMDGWSLRDELHRRADLAHIPVIVLSAALWDRDKHDSLGAVEFMAKPFELDALLATIRRAVCTV